MTDHRDRTVILRPHPLSERWRNRRKNGYVLGDFTGEESADAFAEYVRGLVGHTS